MVELSIRDLQVPGSSPGDATFSAPNFLGQGIHSHCSGQLSLNRVPASAGVRAGMVDSDGCQVTLCDTIWHAISRSGEVLALTAIHALTFF